MTVTQESQNLQRVHVFISLSMTLATTYLIHFLLPLCCHGGPGGVSSIRDSVEDFGSGASGLVDLWRIPPGQDFLQSCRYHAMLIAGNVYQVAAERMELHRKWERKVVAVLRVTMFVLCRRKMLLLLRACPNTWAHPEEHCLRGWPTSQTPAPKPANIRG